MNEPIHRSSHERLAFTAAFFVLLALLLFIKGHPGIGSNEAVYLVNGKRLIDPGFLSGDWTFDGAQQGLNLVFSGFMAVLWWLFDDAIKVAIAARVVCWSALLLAIGHLARTLEIGAVAVVAAVGFLILFDVQSIAAGEWLFHHAEQKVAAYACVLLSLSLLLRQRYAASGVAAGAAVWFHVLVGSWAGLALGIAALVASLGHGARRFFRFALPAAALATGAAATFVPRIFGKAPPATAELAIDHWKFYATVRAPHHLDPSYFMPGALWAVGVVVLFALVVLLSWTTFRQRAVVTVFIAAIAAFFLSGLVFRQAGFFLGLNLYPFRVADTLVPLFLSLAAMHNLWQLTRAAERPRASQRVVWLVVPAALVGLALTATQSTLGLKNLRMPYWTLESSLRHWNRSIDGSGDDFVSMATWIRDNTARRAVFVVDPCEDRFWILAERPVVVAWKMAPIGGPRTAEWIERMAALHGSRPVGEAEPDNFCPGGSARGYRELSADSLARLRRRYEAAYYLVARRRDDLGAALVHRDGEQFLYRIGEGE